MGQVAFHRPVFERLVEDEPTVSISAEDATLMSLGGDDILAKQMTRNWSHKIRKSG